MCKENNVVKNESTEVFYDLAKRSFEASWNKMQEMTSDSISYLVDDADFMSAFIQITINHICHNFEKFTTQEQTPADIEDVNFEVVAEKLVRNAWSFC
jgi:hypothetical protein